MTVQPPPTDPAPPACHLVLQSQVRTKEALLQAEAKPQIFNLGNDDEGEVVELLGGVGSSLLDPFEGPENEELDGVGGPSSGPGAPGRAGEALRGLQAATSLGETLELLSRMQVRGRALVHRSLGCIGLRRAVEKSREIVRVLSGGPLNMFRVSEIWPG